MRFILDEQISEKYPALNFGIVIGKKVNNLKKNSALMQIFNGLTAQVQKQLSNTDLKESPKFTNWRTIFTEMGAKTYNSSMEKIISDVLKSKPVIFNENLSKIRDYFMVKWQIPITCFSLDDIYGDIELILEKNKIFYRDKGGKLTRKWNSEQIDRGSLHPETSNVVFIIENLGILQEEELKDKIHELAVMVHKYCDGDEFEEDIIKPPRKEKDLGVIGLTEFEEIEESPKESTKEPAKEETKEEKETAPKKMESTIEEAEQKAEEKADMSFEKPKEESEEKVEEPPEKQMTIEKEESIDKNSLKARLKVLLQEACKIAYPEADVDSLSIEYPRDPDLGDYACSIAMKLSKQLVKEPMIIAERIVKSIESIQFIESVEPVMPGFINIKIARSWLESKIKDISEDVPLYDNTMGSHLAAVVDYSAPNIAKPLGVHHLLSTIIGQAVYNIYKSLGYKTVGDNHLGDWGTQFGKLIYAYKNWGNRKTIEKDPIPELLKLYVKYHEESEQDPSLDDKAREEFKKMEENNEENIQLWEWFKKLSMEDLEKTYETLGIHFDEFIGESFYNDKMDEVIDAGKDKGVFKEGEGGALIVEFEKDELPPYMVKKSDGATLYSTRDLATIAYRNKRWNPSQIIYIVDSAQSLHFKQLFATAKLMGMTDAKLVHVDFGRMSLPDRSMSTRKGNVVLLDDLLKQGIEKANEIVKEKSKDLNKKEKEDVAKKVAIGAIKYNILSQNRTTNIMFDWDKMLSLEGNSAPYMQYTYARAESILRKYDEMTRKGKKEEKKKEKAEDEKEENNQTSLFDAINRMEGYDDSLMPFEHPRELAVARLIVKFQEYLVLASEEYKPNLFANFLYELAREFNSFYTSVKVLQAESKHVRLARLNLTKAAARALKEGLEILGIEVPERM